MSVRIYRFPDLRTAGVPFTRMHVDRLEKRGEFPKRFSYGANSVAWVADEVDAWLQGRIAARNGAEVVPGPGSEPADAPGPEDDEPFTLVEPVPPRVIEVRMKDGVRMTPAIADEIRRRIAQLP